MDADCAIWDHVVQLFVCCNDGERGSGAAAPCDKCDSTVWLAAHHPGTSFLSRFPLPDHTLHRNICARWQQHCLCCRTALRCLIYMCVCTMLMVGFARSGPR